MRFCRAVLEINRKALKVKIYSKVALRQVVRKHVSFQDHKKENTRKFSCVEN